MAIKGGDLIHIGNMILIDRVQSAGPGNITITPEKIYELGNYKSIGTVYDTPDLTFTLESFDASAEFEATITNQQYIVNNRTQTVTITGSPTGGTFTLTYSGQTTAGIDFDAAASEVETALVALSNLAADEVTVSGSAGGPYTVEFTIDGAALMTASGAGLTGGTTPNVTVTGGTGSAMPDGTAIYLAEAKPMDIVSAFKPGKKATNAYDVVGSAAIPYLQVESVSYRFGVGENASQTVTARGDSVFYHSGAMFVEEFAGTNAANQSITLSHPVVVYNGDTTVGDRYALSVSLASGERLTIGADFTETPSGVGPGYSVTLTILDAVPTSDKIRVTYASTERAVYPQLSHAAVTATRPAALRGRNIEVRIGGTTLSDRWTSIQNVTVDYRVTLEKDEELGNPLAVANEYDVPEVSGSIDVKPRDFDDFYDKVRQIASVADGEVVGPLTTGPLPLMILLYSPDVNQVLKTLYVPDARFTLPGYSGRVQQKQTVTFPFSSDSGELIVYKGARP